MKAKVLLLMYLATICFVMFAFVVQASTRPKALREKPKITELDPYAPVPAAPIQPESSSSEESKLAAKRLAQQVFDRWQVTGTATESEKALMEKYIFVPRSHNEGTRSLDSQGGPDGFGYKWKDNQAPDTATFAWIELRGDTSATFLAYTGSHDDATLPVPISFSFTFYGNPYTSVNVCTNGNLQFTTTNTGFTNAALPYSSMAGPVIFPYWDDLNLDFGGNGTAGNNTIAYRNFGTFTVIEFDSIGHCCTAGTSLKFEVILYDNGRIRVQYNNMVFGTNTLTSTVGIQSAGTGTNFLQYVFNGAPAANEPANGRAIWFYQAPGLLHDFACQGTSSPNGNYQPGSNAVVTFTAFNPGVTTESSPVKYRFNGGAVVTENTAALAQFATEVHTFTTQITVPGVVGDYPLLVWTDLPGDLDHTNDTCHVTVHVRNCVDFTLAAPGTVSGSTVGAGDDCPLRPGEDQIVQVTIPDSGQWTFSLCGSSTSWDSYVLLTTTCCGGTTINSNDDGCAPLSKIACQPLLAGTYYLDIEPFSSGENGPWTLSVTQCVPCVITQQGGDVAEAAENPADTTFYRTDPDGGCNSSLPAFGSISCGQTVFGHLFTYTGPGGVARADSDWYSINAATPESLTVDIISEVPMRLGIVKYGHASACDSALLFINSVTSFDSCVHYVITSPECRAPGLYALLVVPNATTGITTPREYRMALSCSPCTPPSPPTNDSCSVATPITVPANGSTQVTGSTALADVSCTDTCEFISSSPDVFYRLTVTGCRLIEMKLESSLNSTSGDMHIAVYPPGQCCTSPALLCDDDWGNFNAAGMPWAVHTPTYSLSSWVADSLSAGTYIIRVGRYFTSSGSYSLVIYDDGGCSLACDSARNVTAFRVDPTRTDSCIEVRWDVTAAGSYEVWSATDKNSPWTPGGVWTLETTIVAPVGNSFWRDPATLQPFKRHVVSHNCP